MMPARSLPTYVAPAPSPGSETQAWEAHFEYEGVKQQAMQQLFRDSP